MNEFSLLNDRTPTEEKNVENENQPQTFEEPTKQSAGLIKIPERTFEYDLAIGDRYQNFSAEMLRLALLGITAIGFLLLNFFLGTSDKAPEAFGIAKKTLANSDFRFYIFSSLYLFGFSAGFALLHRFFTSDSLAYHLKYLRLREKIRLTKQTKTTENVSHLIQHSQRSFFDGFWLYLFGSEADEIEQQAENEKDARDSLFKIGGWLLFLSGLLLWLGAVSLILAFGVVFKQFSA